MQVPKAGRQPGSCYKKEPDATLLARNNFNKVFFYSFFLSFFPLPEEALLSIVFREVAGYVYVSLLRADSSSTVPENEAYAYTQYLFLF